MNNDVNDRIEEITLWSPLLEAAVSVGSKAKPAMNLKGYPPLLHHILDGLLYRPLLQSSEIEKHRKDWRDLIRALILCPPQDHALIELFHTRWTESHHHIRELVADDMLLMDMLWIWLPRYVGPERQLYRGENISRFRQGMIGTAWTKERKVAQMFANGLNAGDSGGVVLEICASSEAIIAGPSKHSIYLGEHEFTVDWRKLNPTALTALRARHGVVSTS